MDGRFDVRRHAPPRGAFLSAMAFATGVLLNGCGGGDAPAPANLTSPPPSSGSTTVRAIAPSQLLSVLANPNLDFTATAVFDPNTSRQQTVALAGLQFDATTNEFVGQASTEFPAGAINVALHYAVDDATFGSVVVAATADDVPLSKVVTNGSLDFGKVPTLLPDDDRDGISNLTEVLAGTDPNDPKLYPPPAPPSSVSVTLSALGTVISWPASSGATDYKVYVAYDPVDATESVSNWQIIDTQSTALTVPSLTTATATAVFARVAAVNAAGVGTQSPFGSSDPTLTPPAATQLAQSSDVLIQDIDLLNTVPAKSATNVPLNVRLATGVITTTPGEIIRSSWLQLLDARANNIAGFQIWTRTATEQSVVFVPDVALQPNAKYTVIVRAGTSLTPTGPTTRYWDFWDFTTGAVTDPNIDSTPPVLVSVTPPRQSRNVAPGTPITLTFSEPVDLNSVGNAVTVSDTNGLVSGNWTIDGNTATFDGANILANTTYIVRVSNASPIRDLAANPMTRRVRPWSFTTTASVTPADTTAPTVVSIDPTNNSSSVPVNKSVTVIFSEPVALRSLQTNASVLSNGVVVPGTWQANGTTATFTPQAAWSTQTTYTLNIGGGVTDVAGNAMGNPFTSTFTTEAAPPPADTTPPAITGLTPKIAEANVALTQPIVVSFSEPVLLASLQSGTSITSIINNAAATVSGSWSVNGNVATFQPTGGWLPGTHYVAILAATVSDLAGNQLGARVLWEFDTVAAPPPADTTPPSVTGITPKIAEQNVALTSPIIVTFNEPVSLASVQNSSNIVVIVNTTAARVNGAWSVDGNSVIFRPTGGLLPNAQYDIYILGTVTDLAGNALGSRFQWEFYTGPASATDTTPPTVTAISPKVAETNVALTAPLNVTFSEPISLTSLQTNTSIVATLSTGATRLTGSWAVSGNIATFSPTGGWAPSTRHIVEIGANVTDLAGNPLGTLMTWAFDTAAALP